MGVCLEILCVGEGRYLTSGRPVLVVGGRGGEGGEECGELETEQTRNNAGNSIRD